MNETNFNFNDGVTKKIKFLLSKPKLPLTVTIHTNCKEDITAEEIISLKEKLKKDCE